MSHFSKLGCLILIACMMTFAHPAPAEQPVVHAVLFWSDTCPHCHYVMENVLPPIQAQYGAQFRLKMLQVSEPANSSLYQTMVRLFNVAPERQGVPTLLIGDQVLVGSREIPAELPGQIERYLAAGGVNFPPLPGLDQAPGIDMCGTTPCADRSSETVRPTTGSDALANTLAGAVLLGLAAVVVYALVSIARGGWQITPATDPPHPTRKSRRAAPVLSLAQGLIPVFATVGLGVATYLAYTKLAHTDVICGPVGDCDAVQVSSYSELLGIPVAVLGALTYLGIWGSWVSSRLPLARLALLGQLGLFGLSLVGALFSFYLTFLEPFVIGAVCTWCLVSAVMMMLILWLATRNLSRQASPPRQTARD